MHKFFAKTLFLGKKIIFLPQCHSTNTELVARSRELTCPEGMIVYTDYQKSGKGQRGNEWIADPGKNILMSVLLHPRFLTPKEQYFLNLIVGLAIVDVVKEYVLHDEVSLKWPNDIFIKDKKVAGVLIESSFRGGSLESSVVGVGLNVNQRNFELPTATSMNVVNPESVDLDREIVLENLLLRLEFWYLKLKNGAKDDIRNAYHSLLMWRGEERRFKSELEEFEGEIVGINEYGKLSIKVQNKLRVFDVKEIEFVS